MSTASHLTNAQQRPTFSPETVRAVVHERWGLDGSLDPLPAERDQNFLLRTNDARTFVVKIARRTDGDDVLDLQNQAMRWIGDHATTDRCPRPVPTIDDADRTAIADEDGHAYGLRVLTYLDGLSLAGIRPLEPSTLESLGETLGGELDRTLAGFRHPSMRRDLRWDLASAMWISAHTGRIADPARRGLVERLLLQYRGRVVPRLPGLPASVIHSDANDENVLVQRGDGDGWRVTGLLDFGDMLWSHTVNELAIACAYAVFETSDPLALATHVVRGYDRARPLDDEELAVVMPLTVMRLCVSVTMSAIAAEEDPDNPHARISDGPAWQTLERMAGIDWNAAEDQLRRVCGRPSLPSRRDAAEPTATADLLDRRRRSVGPSLSLAYDTPLVIVRGRGQFLFDADDRAHLDCVNNVCHVGHGHPRVVAALAEQAATLNTNTRYAHPLLVEYAERLTSTLPNPLEVCYFVTSGSEANELAVRLARTFTGRRDVIVVDGAYHGHTTTLVDLSPYKAEGPGGRGLADWAHKVATPDRYRGAHRGNGPSVGAAYAREVDDTCARLTEEGRPPAMFMAESIMGCAGQVVLPGGYLREAFAAVRDVGGVCVVDEVQVGFGRAGTHMWAFQTQDVVPDIVTLGKPIGNGHPIGAVVTTREVADAFANGMEFFSTFGGNPVSCAVGMAVLDVMADERLQERAARVGAYLADGFRALAKRHEAIGDVRGLGLFMGIELVADRETLEPATTLTKRLIERCKADGVLLSAEGPHLNVLKIKPPLAFEEPDADLLLGAVDRALP